MEITANQDQRNHHGTFAKDSKITREAAEEERETSRRKYTKYI